MVPNIKGRTGPDHSHLRQEGIAYVFSRLAAARCTSPQCTQPNPTPRPPAPAPAPAGRANTRPRATNATSTQRDKRDRRAHNLSNKAPDKPRDEPQETHTHTARQLTQRTPRATTRQPTTPDATKTTTPRRRNDNCDAHRTKSHDRQRAPQGGHATCKFADTPAQRPAPTPRANNQPRDASDKQTSNERNGNYNRRTFINTAPAAKNKPDTQAREAPTAPTQTRPNHTPTNIQWQGVCAPQNTRGPAPKARELRMFNMIATRCDRTRTNQRHTAIANVHCECCGRTC